MTLPPGAHVSPVVAGLDTLLPGSQTQAEHCTLVSDGLELLKGSFSKVYPVTEMTSCNDLLSAIDEATRNNAGLLEQPKN